MPSISKNKLNILNFNQFKSFESISESKLWEEIDQSEWYKKHGRKHELFTESEISNIKELIEDEYDKFVYNDLKRHLREKDTNYFKQAGNYIYFQLIFSSLHIYKFDDDWYLVNQGWINGDTYWEADTFEGLIQLIKYVNENA